MLVIYESDYKNLSAVFSGHDTSVDIVKKHVPAFVNHKGIMLDDDKQVIQHMEKYRIVEEVIGKSRCELKPLAELKLSKSQIISNGSDESVLNITLSELQPEDNISEIDVFFNGTASSQPVAGNLLELPISSITPGTIEIKVNSKLFRFNPVSLEVV